MCPGCGEYYPLEIAQHLVLRGDTAYVLHDVSLECSYCGPTEKGLSPRTREIFIMYAAIVQGERTVDMHEDILSTFSECWLNPDQWDEMEALLERALKKELGPLCSFQ